MEKKAYFTIALTGAIMSGCGSSESTLNSMAVLGGLQKMVNMQKRMNQEPVQIPNYEFAYNMPQKVNDTNLINDLKIVSEIELSKKMAQYPLSPYGVKFDKNIDGFAINGDDVYLDPEGQIVNFGANWQNGSFFYLVKLSSTQYKVKFNRVGSKKEALDIAYVEKRGSLFSIKTITGKKLTGEGLILTSKGFIVTRESTAFIYTVGSGIKNFVAPTGWHIASFQNGDVASTNFLLLEKNFDVGSSSKNPLGDLIDSTQELANVFGLIEKNDYMLINIEDSSQKHLLNITLGDKEIALYSDCRRMNKFMSKCNNMETRESLYKVNGLKNFTHYYWTVQWFLGNDTIFSVTKESGNKKVFITDLQTGKKVEAAFRVTGFPEFETEQTNDGIVKLHVSGSLLPGVDVENVEDFLKTNKNILVKK